MGKSQQSEFQVFSGGINTRTAAHLMQPTESLALSNVEIRSHALTSKQGHTQEESDTLSMFYWFQDQYYYYDAFRSNVTWNGVYYYSDAFTVKKIIPGIGELSVGIAPPIAAPTIAVDPAAGEGLTGQYTYVYTYINKATGVESPPSPPAVSVHPVNEAVLISDLVEEPGPLDYAIRLYRVGEGITVFTSVVTLPKTATEYKDELHFTEIEAHLLNTTRAFPPEDIMVNLSESRGRFYGSVGSFLRWSAQGKPDSWYILDSMDFPETITMVAAVANGLIVCTRYQTWLVVGDTPARFQRHLLSASEGCISHQSLAVYHGTAIWLSDDGLVSSNGGVVTPITIGKLDRITGIDPLSATVHNNTYYMGYQEQIFPADDLYPAEDFYPAMIENNQEFPTGIYIIDFSFGDARILFSYQEKIGYIDVAGDNLDQVQREEILPLSIITEDGNRLVLEDGITSLTTELTDRNNRYHMFNADTQLNLLYLSPLFTEGSVGVEKQFEKARIMFKGEFDVKLYDHQGELLADTSVSSDKYISKWIGISPQKNRGYGIQYDIRGVGDIFSLSHVWTPREAQ